MQQPADALAVDRREEAHAAIPCKADSVEGAALQFCTHAAPRLTLVLCPWTCEIEQGGDAL